MNWSEIRHFTSREFECRCCGVEMMNEAFVKKLDAAREEANVPFTITSGYRCSRHNEAVSNSGPYGPHTTGLAADIGLSGVEMRDTLTILSDMFERIGLNQRGDWERRFVHVDDLNDPGLGKIWTY